MEINNSTAPMANLRGVRRSVVILRIKPPPRLSWWVILCGQLFKPPDQSLSTRYLASGEAVAWRHRHYRHDAHLHLGEARWHGCCEACTKGPMDLAPAVVLGEKFLLSIRACNWAFSTPDKLCGIFRFRSRLRRNTLGCGPDTIAGATKRSASPVYGTSQVGPAHSLDAIGLASGEGICHHRLGFINWLANRGEHLKGGN
jgi:hypothetical protein